MSARRKFGLVAPLLAVAFAATGGSAPSGALARAQAMDEYYVKAGFVSSLASFVEWPPEAFGDPRAPLSICVLGRDPFGSWLDSLVEGKVVDSRALVVRRLTEVQQASGCHIVYVSASEHLRFRAILRSLHDRSVLSIGDTNDFIAEGGIVNLRVEGGKMRIEINTDAAREQHLRISSRLLQLARTVRR